MEEILASFLEKVAGLMEILTYTSGIIGIGGHRHNTNNFYAFHCTPRPFFKKPTCFVGSKTEFCFFLSYMKLEQARDGTADLYSLFVDFREQMCRVHRMNEVDVGSYIFDLVGLQMSDEMPFEIQVCQFLVLTL